MSFSVLWSKSTCLLQVAKSTEHVKDRVPSCFQIRQDSDACQRHSFVFGTAHCPLWIGIPLADDFQELVTTLTRFPDECDSFAGPTYGTGLLCHMCCPHHDWSSIRVQALCGWVCVWIGIRHVAIVLLHHLDDHLWTQVNNVGKTMDLILLLIKGDIKILQYQGKMKHCWCIVWGIIYGEMPNLPDIKIV
jgi:hypothetical protein